MILFYTDRKSNKKIGFKCKDFDFFHLFKNQMYKNYPIFFDYELDNVNLVINNFVVQKDVVDEMYYDMYLKDSISNFFQMLDFLYLKKVIKGDFSDDELDNPTLWNLDLYYSSFDFFKDQQVLSKEDGNKLIGKVFLKSTLHIGCDEYQVDSFVFFNNKNFENLEELYKIVSEKQDKRCKIVLDDFDFESDNLNMIWCEFKKVENNNQVLIDIWDNYSLSINALHFYKEQLLNLLSKKFKVEEEDFFKLCKCNEWSCICKVCGNECKSCGNEFEIKKIKA